MSKINKASKKILGMGCATMDIVLECANLPTTDSFSMLYSEQVMSGGSCANTLAALASLEAETLQVAQIGDDALGKTFAAELESAGVETKWLFVKPGGTTMHTYIFVAKDGDHAIVSNLGDCIMTLSTDEVVRVADELLAGVDIFYTDLFPTKPALALAKICREKNIRVICGLQCPADFMATCGVAKEDILAMVALADLIIGGQESYLQLVADWAKEKPLQAVQELVKTYKPALGGICTAGSAGAFWWIDEQLFTSSAYEVEVKDTTGAGDSFLAGLIYGYFVKGLPKQEAMNFAAATAALKCTQLGARLTGKEADVLQIMTQKN